ncbi:MAG TPA: MmcQ/YjbR family DNA-binding protein [Actinopolymorphaceae bacterium]
MVDENPLERLRRICLALPETSERLSHGEPTWFAGRGSRTRSFVMYADRHHDDRVAFWCAAPEGIQQLFVENEPHRFFRPPYVGGRGWLGVYLDIDDVDWERIEEIVADAHEVVARR